MKTIKDLCAEYTLTQTELAKHFDIPLRTIQNWAGGQRTPPDYVVRMMDKLLKLKKLQLDIEIYRKLSDAEQEAVLTETRLSSSDILDAIANVDEELG